MHSIVSAARASTGPLWRAQVWLKGLAGVEQHAAAALHKLRTVHSCTATPALHTFA